MDSKIFCGGDLLKKQNIKIAKEIEFSTNNENKLQQKIEVKDDLGLGLESATYTLGAILMQAHSHVIHHFASVGYIIYHLGIELPDASFGFNPTTPKICVHKN